jgi:hypothetical protein
MESNNIPDKKLNTNRLSFLCGVASYFGDLLIYPLDTINTRMKANRLESMSLRHAIQYFHKKDGFVSFYKGANSAVPMSFIAVYVYFYMYESINKRVLDFQKTIEYSSKNVVTFLLPFVSAALAEATIMGFYIPCDAIRTRLQTNEYKYKGMVDGLVQTYKTEGFARLYAASHLYISSQIVYTSCEFGLYEFLRKKILVAKQRDGLLLEETLGVTLIASGLAALIINPLDLLMVRYQLIDTRYEKLGLLRTTKNILSQEGVAAFYKGMSARVTYAMAYSLIMFPIYEHLRQAYGVNMLDF